MLNFQFRKLPANKPGQIHPKSFRYSRPFIFEQVILVDGAETVLATQQDRNMYPTEWRVFDHTYASTSNTPLALLLVQDPELELTIDNLIMGGYNSIEWISQLMTVSEITTHKEKSTSLFTPFDLNSFGFGSTDEIIALCRQHVSNRKLYKIADEHAAFVRQQEQGEKPADPNAKYAQYQDDIINARQIEREKTFLGRNEATVVRAMDQRSVAQRELDELTTPKKPEPVRDAQVEFLNTRRKAQEADEQRAGILDPKKGLVREQPEAKPHKLNEYDGLEHAPAPIGALPKENSYPAYTPELDDEGKINLVKRA